jgi:DNA repair protein SbcD/Mre11
VRLLHIADVHLQRPFKWLGPGRGRARRSELTETLGRVVDLARARQVDALCIAGDLFERESATPVLGEVLRSTFARLGDVPVLIAPGNHDYFTPGCLYDQVSWSTNVSIFREPALAPVVIADGTVWGGAFRGPERLDSPIVGFQAPAAGLHVGLIHGDLVDENATSVYAPLRRREIAESSLAFAMLGHVHAGNVDEPRRWAYPGSLEPLDTSESGPRWALLLDVSHSGTVVERLAVATRRVLAEDLDVSSISTLRELRLEIEKRSAGWASADVKLRVVGTLYGELDDPATLTEALTGFDVDLTVEARPDVDLVALAREPTVLGAFVRAAQKRRGETTDEAAVRHWEDTLAAGLAAFRNEELVLR